MIDGLLAWKLPWAADAEGFWSDSFLYLMLVLALLLAVQVGIVTWIWLRTRWQRRHIPLVIGGWGTRGKSGTERCKAALFHGYGAKVFSKTTGCEAMFIAAMPRQPSDEIFLFRPMEKATIYEQVDVLRAAARLRCEVFLYECMALNPRYVEVLQDGWMRDDVGTLTNAYPDHEDVQGPAGRNVAEVIGAFSPKNTVTWTCERQMLPILEAQGRRRGAEIRGVDWLDAALITDDVLERLPYKEHPANLALVAQLGEHFGLDQDFVFKEIADNLVPDLGVLRTFPRIHVAGRSLYFTNGMSANERLGCLGNWQRLGFADHRCRRDPQQWIVCVVNNRADRIPRSKVFAAILAEDVSAHEIVLIGSNVAGLVGYLDEALERAGELYQVGDCRDLDQLDRRLQEVCERLKIVARHRADLDLHARLLLGALGQSSAVVDGFLGGEAWERALVAAEAVQGEAAERSDPALAGAWQQVRPELVRPLADAWDDRRDTLLPTDVVTADSALDQLGRFWREYRQVCSLLRELRGMLRADGIGAAGDRVLRAFVRRWVLARLTVIEDQHATGDQILNLIVERVPPGHDAHLLGMQNIKGTGLDFAYRWVGILRVADWCFGLRSPVRSVRLEHLKNLSSHGDFHHYEARYALSALLALREEEDWQADADRQELDRAIRVVRLAVAATVGGTVASTDQGHWYDGLATALEPLLDVGDSILRRIGYQRTLGDYVAGRLSRTRTAATMASLVKRQKGDWVKAWFDTRWSGSDQGDDELVSGDLLQEHLRPYAASDFVQASAGLDLDALKLLEDADLGPPRR